MSAPAQEPTDDPHHDRDRHRGPPDRSHRTPRRRRRRRHRPRAPSGRGGGSRRRVRQRQDDRRHLAARLHPARRDVRERQGALRGQGRPRASVAAGPPAARGGDRLRPAGSGRRPEPQHPHRQADRRADGAARSRHLREPAEGRARGTGRGRSAQRRRVPQPLLPPALRRTGSARRPGDGVPAQAQGAGARRADHRARRHDPGHGPGDDGRALPHLRRRRALRHPRPGGDRQHRRPGRGDVRRPDRRARPS